MAKRGRFRPERVEKYRGDPTAIVWRSLWELKVMMRFDRDPNVLEWSSECVVVPYKDRSSGRLRRYFPDFWFRRFDGRMFMVEVKPHKETIPPDRANKTERRFLAEALTYAKNSSKWEAARRYCAERDWDFLIITERELGIKR